MSLLGVAVVAGGGGGSSSVYGDGLVLFSLAISAAMTVAQVRMLEGRDPMAVTAVQFMAAAVTALPIAIVTRGHAAFGAERRSVPRRHRPVRRRARCCRGCCSPSASRGSPPSSPGRSSTSSRWSALAAAALFFGEAITPAQIGAGLAILTGVALSTLASAVDAESVSEPEPVAVRRPASVPEQLPVLVEASVEGAVLVPAATPRVPRMPRVPQRRASGASPAWPAPCGVGGRRGAEDPAVDAWSFDDISADDLVLDRWDTAA